KFVCTVCGKGSSTKRHFARHLLTHSQVREHSCDTCGKRFNCKGHLKRHKENMHPNDRDVRNFACDQCGKRFRTMSQLKDHERSHSDRSFVCADCQKPFKNLFCLNSHHVRMHADNVRAFPCELCGKRFKAN